MAETTLQDKANDAAGIMFDELTTGLVNEWIFITGTTFDPLQAENYLTIGVPVYDAPPCTQSRSFGTAWMTEFSNPGGLAKSVDDARSLVIVSDGLIVTGSSQAWESSGSTDFDYVTVKYDFSGNQQWVNRWNGPGNGPDNPYRIAGARAYNNVPELNNFVYVTGGTWRDSTHRYDIGTIAINPDNGSTVWEHFYRSADGHYDDIGHDVACIPGDEINDASGGVYVTGRGVNVGGETHYVTYRLRRAPGLGSGLGRMLWPAPHVEIVDNRGDDVPTTILLREMYDPFTGADLSEIFVTGRSPVPSGGATIRYTQSP